MPESEKYRDGSSVELVGVAQIASNLGKLSDYDKDLYLLLCGDFSAMVGISMLQ